MSPSNTPESGKKAIQNSVKRFTCKEYDDERLASDDLCISGYHFGAGIYPISELGQ